MLPADVDRRYGAGVTYSCTGMQATLSSPAGEDQLGHASEGKGGYTEASQLLL